MHRSHARHLYHTSLKPVHRLLHAYDHLWHADVADTADSHHCPEHFWDNSVPVEDTGKVQGRLVHHPNLVPDSALERSVDPGAGLVPDF